MRELKHVRYYTTDSFEDEAEAIEDALCQIRRRRKGYGMMPPTVLAFALKYFEEEYYVEFALEGERDA